MTDVLDMDTVLTYARFLKGLEEKTMQVLRIKNQIDEKMIQIVDKLKDDLTNANLIASLEDLRRREERVKNYIKNGLYTIEGDIMPKLEAAKKEIPDIEKLKFVINFFMKELAKATLRLRKEKHFIEDPSEKNFKKFVKAYHKELSLGSRLLNEIAGLRFESISDRDIKMVVYAGIGSMGLNGILQQLEKGHIDPLNGFLAMVSAMVFTMVSLYLLNSNKREDYIGKLKRRYGFSFF
ncbi:MAG: hypothetical protein AABX00_03610 [Nanoarchaeota archaeon]